MWEYLPPLCHYLSLSWRQWRHIEKPSLNCCVTARHSLSTHSPSCSFTNNTCSPTHTNTQVQMLTHIRPQPPSLLDLLSHPRTPYSFPPSGNLFHVNTTSICGAALSLSQSHSGKTNDVCIHPASPLRSPPPHCVCGSLYTALTGRASVQYSTVQYSVCFAEVLLS